MGGAGCVTCVRSAPRQSPCAIRLRLVEVGTAIMLLEVLLPPANVDRQLKAIVAELEQAGAKMAVPEDQRYYLGIMAIKSEEPGESLTGTCRALTALVEARLHQRPQFIVLEHEQLRRLTDESNLTGAELRLRASAWLLEVGGRHRDGGGLVVSCRLLAPSKGASQTLRVEAASSEQVEIRNQLVAPARRTQRRARRKRANSGRRQTGPVRS